MKNRDKRSLIFAMVLGDGCIHYTSNKTSCALTLNHGIAQADYQAWKAQLLSQIFNRNVKVRPGHNNKSVQVSICANVFKAWRKFCYPNGKKQLPNILRYITHPEMALAIWLMDDGYVEPSLDKKYPGKCYGAVFRIFTCDQSMENQELIIKWFQETFDVTLKVAMQKKGDTYYPFLKFNTPDSLKLWEKVRPFILQFNSMKHKFRYMEQRYQYKSITASTTCASKE